MGFFDIFKSKVTTETITVTPNVNSAYILRWNFQSGGLGDLLKINVNGNNVLYRKATGNGEIVLSINDIVEINGSIDDAGKLQNIELEINNNKDKKSLPENEIYYIIDVNSNIDLICRTY